MNKKSDWQEVFDKVKWQDLSENLDIDQDEAEAGVKLFREMYMDHYWQDFVAQVRFGHNEEHINEAIFEEFFEIYNIPENVEMWIDRDRVINDLKMDWHIHEVKTADGYTRFFGWRGF